MNKVQDLFSLFLIAVAACISSCGDNTSPSANDDVVLSSSSIASSTSDGSSGVDLSSSVMLSSVLEMSSSTAMSSAIEISSSTGTSFSTPKGSQSSSITTSTPSSSARGSSGVVLVSSSAIVASSSAGIPVTTAVRDCDYVENTATTPVTGSLTCPNNEVYKTVKIGDAVWLAQNLNYGMRVNGTLVTDNQSDDGVVEKYCYKDNEANCNTDGALYQWSEAMGFQSACNQQFLADCGATISTPHKGICPTGWHIPSATDWDVLVTALGGDADVVGERMKLSNTIFDNWNSSHNDGNSSGFSAYPAGIRYNRSGGFYHRGSGADIWEASASNASEAYYHDLSPMYSFLTRSGLDKQSGRSVRCVKDP